MLLVNEITKSAILDTEKNRYTPTRNWYDIYTESKMKQRYPEYGAQTIPPQTIPPKKHRQFRPKYSEIIERPDSEISSSEVSSYYFIQKFRCRISYHIFIWSPRLVDYINITRNLQVFANTTLLPPYTNTRKFKNC